MKSIKAKIIGFMLVSSMTLLAVMQAYITINIYIQNKHALQKTEALMLSTYDTNIRNQVENIVSLMQGVYQYQKEHDLSEAEGKNLAKELIRNIRYNKSGYFWIDTYEGTNILLPPKKSVEGTNRYEDKDQKGNSFMKDIITKGKEGGGYSNYWFPKPGEKEASLKRSYSLAFEPYQWVTGTGNYIDDINKAIMEQEKQQNKEFRISLIISIIIFATAILLALLLSLLLGKSIAAPVIEVANFANRVSQGNLTEKINKTLSQRKDEIGTMIQAIQHLETNLNEIIQEINKVAFQLSTSSEESSSSALAFADNAQQQAASIEEINATVEEVSAGVESISNNTNEQLKSVQSLSESVTHLKTIEERIKNIIGSIASLSQNISSKAEEGNTALGLMSDRFREISESSNHMLGMIEIITGIADQINLLALNASIESARAGEAGRGFAVVADEISKLADETARNVKMIQDNITLSDKKIKHGESIVSDSLETLKVVIEGVQEIHSSIRNVENEIIRQAEISENVNHESLQVKNKSEEIQISISEQKNAMHEITSSVTVINHAVQTTASGAEQIASASEEISSMSQVLTETLSFFKVNS